MTSNVATAADLAATTGPVLTAAEQEELIRTHMPLVGHLVRDMLSRIPNHIHSRNNTSMRSRLAMTNEHGHTTVGRGLAAAAA